MLNAKAANGASRLLVEASFVTLNTSKISAKPDLGSPNIRCDGIRRQWQQYFHVGGTAALLELTACLDHVLGSAAAVSLHQALHPDQRLHILAQTIRPESLGIL